MKHIIDQKFYHELEVSAAKIKEFKTRMLVAVTHISLYLLFELCFVYASVADFKFNLQLCLNAVVLAYIVYLINICAINIARADVNIKLYRAIISELEKQYFTLDRDNIGNFKIEEGVLVGAYGAKYCDEFGNTVMWNENITDLSAQIKN